MIRVKDVQPSLERGIMMEQNHLVSIDWLHNHLKDPNLVIVDCRFALGKPGGNGLAEYMEGHIPGALYVDLEQDLSGAKSVHGGRHPLPETDTLAALFSTIGIDAETTVIAYDEQDLAMAGRLWWLLRYLGHEKVAVLNGGFSAWRKHGKPVSTEVPTPTSKTFTPVIQHDMLVSAEQVKNRSADCALLDSRAGERYRGEVEPLDPKAGHIPGARNYFYKQNFSPEGDMLPAEKLQERFSGLSADQEIVVYCGSGVTGCVNVLALYQAGRTDAKLYAGSWSDWISYPENPVATGEE